MYGGAGATAGTLMWRQVCSELREEFTCTPPGLSMRLLESKKGTSSFAFEHSEEYQQTQHKFLTAVESMEPNNIVVRVAWYKARLLCTGLPARSCRQSSGQRQLVPKAPLTPSVHSHHGPWARHYVVSTEACRVVGHEPHPLQ